MIDIDDNSLLNIELRHKGNNDVTELVRAVVILRRENKELAKKVDTLEGELADERSGRLNVGNPAEEDIFG
jgi:hypothetical protein